MDAKFELSKMDLPFGERHDGIILSYSPEKNFQVRGRRVEFKGTLPQDKTRRLDIVRSSIDKALQNPLKGTGLFFAIYPNYRITH